MSSPSSADAAALPDPATLSIHLDLVGGLAGDMFVAAMVDAFPALAAPVLAALAAAQPAGLATPGFSEAASAGLRARRFGVAATTDTAHGHAHGGHRHGAGSAYPALRRRIADAPLETGTRTHALALLDLLAEAEAHVHGIAIADVHFHELADWDSLLDVVAAGCIAARLAGARWTASPPPLGAGTVRTAHGVLPVPAPATTRLLTGYPWRSDGIAGERVTPTGAAILRHLVPPSACGAPRDSGQLVAVGHGAGTRELPGTPNIVRVLAFDRGAAIGSDAVAVVEFDVDDMTGEEIAHAADRLRAEAGVIDVSLGARTGKKGRPVVDFRLLARPHATAAIAQACFAETSTLGLRVREEQRRLVARDEAAVAVDGVAVRVKVAQRPGATTTAKAAHDDVAATSGLAQRRQRRAAAEREALARPGTAPAEGDE